MSDAPGEHLPFDPLECELADLVRDAQLAELVDAAGRLDEHERGQLLTLARTLVAANVLAEAVTGQPWLHRHRPAN